MQFTTIVSILAMATAAIAAPAPADIEARTGNGGGKPPVCSAKTKQVCCNGLLTCTVQVLGGSCGGNSYCCKTSAPTVSLPRIKNDRLLIFIGYSRQRCCPQLRQAPLEDHRQRCLLRLVELDIRNIWCGGYSWGKPVLATSTGQ
jgi:hypothetical protein